MNNSLDGSEPPRTWTKSSYSNGAGGECVECARVGDVVFVRDTKVGDALVAGLGVQAWLSFTHATEQGWPEAH
ncbi:MULTISPECIES: DUF397 domain-containing protein [unclassified Streptomyces]|uniref:DUF397 domain-containing protein n=1 Tax=unclassified Streptomyces TaxID=2593676 RepID=UPI00244164D9|nr:DUF397 domain-containing protein [Streptomyces sp. DH41]MDG9721665.1 DUF397 domain-containing protein [Streptomyces sp. DH41]